MAEPRYVKAWRRRVRAAIKDAKEAASALLTYQASHSWLVPPLMTPTDITLFSNVQTWTTAKLLEVKPK